MEANSFLDRTTLRVDRAALENEPAELSDKQIGPYRISTLLGHGGMGVVYLAEQLQPVRRTVALKLMRNALVDVIGRAYFEVECQALARMEHPAIARLYDAGTTDHGRPYLVMEFIDGRPLSDYADSSKLTMIDRVTLFQRLCQGVQHVHQHGLIHRDLKPDNILVREVDGVAWPTLIDFGLAIATRSDHQQGGSRPAGTDLYMSPEQGRGEHALDTRSDVYTLGVILLELLAQQQFERASSSFHDFFPWHQLLSGSTHSPQRNAESEQLSRDLQSLPRALRWILSRALAPERDQRYATAAALSADLGRWLLHQPVDAAPNRPGYRAGLFLQRNRLAVGLGAGAAMVLVAALLLTSYGLLQARSALARADQEAAKATEVAHFLGEVLTSIDPQVAGDLDRTLLRKVLDQAAHRAGRELAGQPQVLSEIEYAIGRSYAALVDQHEALPFLQRAWQASKQEHGALAEQTFARFLALLNTTMGAGLPSQAKADTEALLAELRAAGRGESVEANLLLGYIAWFVHTELGPAQSMPLFERAAERLASQVDADDSRWLRFQMNMAINLTELERFDEAQTIYLDIIERTTRLQGADHPRTLMMRNSLAVLSLDRQDYTSAAAQLEDLLPLQEQIFGIDNEVTTNTRSNLASALRKGGQLAASAPHYRKVQELITAKLGRDNPRTVIANHNYANFLLESGDFRSAIEYQHEALLGAEAALPGNAWVRSEVLGGLGQAETAAGLWLDAQTHLLQAIKDKESVLPANHHRLRESIEALIALYTQWGEQAALLQQWQTRLTQFEQATADGD